MKLTFTTKPNYAEESQSNPIRWAILSGSPEKGFTNESAWLKCKDFFNDYAIAYNGGTRFGIYGFSTVGMTIPDKGMPVYMAVKCLTKNFHENLKTFNHWLNAQGHPDIWYDVVDDVTVLGFGEFFFKNTYNISLVSLMIRLLNDETFNGTIEDLKTHKIPGDGRDQQKWGVVVKKGVFFKLPEKLDKFLWYCGEKSNSAVADVPVYQLSSLIHNNGVVSWSSYF